MKDNPVRFQRWYDHDIYLSELVGCLEHLTWDSKTLFAFLLNFFSDDIKAARGREFFSQMEWDKLIGLYKSLRGRRWYDQEPVLKKAFNKLYALPDSDKSLIAAQLIVPGRLVSDYERFCVRLAQKPDIETVCKILEVFFSEGGEAAMQRFRDFSSG